MRPERVVVIIANRNYGHFIEGCLSSAVDEKPSLVVVVDDGSTDDSADRVVSMMDHPKTEQAGEVPYCSGLVSGIRVNLFAANESRGPSSARNWAIRSAWDEADYFAILDADDRFIPGRIDKCLNALNKHGEIAGAVYNDYYHVRDGIRIHHCKPSYSRRGLAVDNMVHSAGIIRKSALAEIGLYDSALPLCEDYELWMRIAQKRVILHVPEPMMLVNEGAWQLSRSQPAEHWTKCLSEVKRRHCQNLLS